LLKACRLVVWEFDHLLAEQKALVPYHSIGRVEPVIDLSDGFGTYSDDVCARSPKVFKTIRYKERKLGRDAGAVSYTFAEGDPAMLRRLMELKSAQYRRTGRMDRFAKPWIVALVEHLHATGLGVLGVLSAGGVPISFHLGLRAGDRMAGWFPAYDVTYGKYSPGMIGHLRLAEGAAEAGVVEIALGRGGREYKDWLKNGEFPIAEGRLARPSARAAAHWLRAVPLRLARDAVLTDPRLYGWADRALKRSAQLRGRPAGSAK
jgi:CelD/BcsL family acetyltransferase involved in cellulose biosynthesis